MYRRRFLPISLVSAAWLLLLLIQGGCSSSFALKDELGLPSSLRGPFIKANAMVYPGQLDGANQFLPAVSLNTPGKRQDGESCSGVLLSPRLVLTAGHCVCLRRQISQQDRKKIKATIERVIASQPDVVKSAVARKILDEANTVIDGSSCAPLAMVTATRYVASTSQATGMDGNAAAGWIGTQYRGRTVRPHEDLMVVFRDKTAIFREADLAIVVLDKPIQTLRTAIRLPRAAVRIGSRVVMVGYGFGDAEETSTSYGNRYFAESMVVDVLTADSPDVMFEVREEPSDGGTASSLYPGDSGGPCFDKADNAVLVGIATAVTSEDEGKKRSVFTSVYPHVDWVRSVARDMGEAVH